MRIDASDVKKLGLLKHYRIIRKWACRNNDLNDADLRIINLFRLFRVCLLSKILWKVRYSYSWDNRRWNKIIKRRLDSLFGEKEIELLKSIIYIKFLLKCKQLNK